MKFFWLKLKVQKLEEQFLLPENRRQTWKTQVLTIIATNDLQKKRDCTNCNDCVATIVTRPIS